MKTRCLVCNKEFNIYPCYVKLGRGKYCSQKCSGKSQITAEKRKCLFCKKEFHAFQSQIELGSAKYCSRKCFNSARIGKMKKCLNCNTPFYSYRSDKKYHNHKYCSLKCYIESAKGKNHWNWRGDDVSYGALHGWVKRKLGFPKKCEICGVENKILDWANKDHTYKRDINNWVRLCKKCHLKYDIEHGYRLPLYQLKILPLDKTTK